MKEGENNNPEEKLETSEVDEPNYDEIDDILDELEGKKGVKSEEKELDDDDSSDEGNKNKNKEEEPKFFKKVGNREFTSEEEYDKFVQEVYNTNSRFAGAIKKLGGNPKEVSKIIVDEYDKKEKEEKGDNDVKPLSDEEQYYRVERIRFTRQFPVAEEYKDEMKLFIEKGKANIDDYPSYGLALIKALRADGKEIPQKLINYVKMEAGKDVENDAEYSKKLIKRGGGSSASANNPLNYSEEQRDSLSEFGDKIATGAIPQF